MGFCGKLVGYSFSKFICRIRSCNFVVYELVISSLTLGSMEHKEAKLALSTLKP